MAQRANIIGIKCKILGAYLTGVLLLFALIAFELIKDKKATIATASQSLENSLIASSTALVATFDTLNVSLWHVSKEIERKPSLVKTFDLTTLKQAPSTVSSFPGLEYTLVDAIGTPMQTTTNRKNFNLADRDYFKTLKDNPDLDFYISDPFYGRLRDAWIFVIARKIRSPEGKFLGVIVAAIDTNALEKFRKNLALGEKGLFTLVIGKQNLFAYRSPSREEFIGKPLKYSPVLEPVIKKKQLQKVSESVSANDGIRYIIGAKWAGTYPVLNIIGLNYKEVLAKWNRLSIIVIATAIVLAFLGFIGANQYIKLKVHSIKKQQELDLASSNLDRIAIMEITDSNGDIRFANQKFCELSGYRQGELIGKNHRIINSGLHSKEFFKNLWQTISSGEVWHGEICNRKKDGSLFWMDSLIFSTELSDGTSGYIALRFDITDRKIAETKLSQSSKLAALGEMAAGIAHEVNNPLAIISGKLNKIKRLMNDSSPKIDLVMEELVKMETNIDRIASIVKGFRAVTRDSNADPFVRTNIKNLITDTISLCIERFKANLVMIHLGNIPPIDIECRATEISQIVLNLLNNAFDAVKILPDKWVRIEAKIVADTIEIAVTDSGKGIPLEVANKLMQPFFTTKAFGEGTGLGLSISRKIAAAHGGQLIFDANASNTRFLLTLPLKQIKSEIT